MGNDTPLRKRRPLEAAGVERTLAGETRLKQS